MSKEQHFCQSNNIVFWRIKQQLTEKSFRLSNGVENGPFFPLLRGGGSGGGIEESAFLGGSGGLTVGTIQSSACEKTNSFVI